MESGAGSAGENDTFAFHMGKVRAIRKRKAET
jgi:hypothetical protein